METDASQDRSKFRRWAEFLWPWGTALLGLLVTPIAIEQYPEVFKENEWILPLSVALMSVLWITPFFFHSRAKRCFHWLASSIGKPLTLVTMLLLAGAIGLGAARTFAFHRDHLLSRLQRQQNVAQPIGASLQFDSTALVFHMKKRAFFIVGQPAAMRIVFANKGPGAAHQVAPEAWLGTIEDGPDLRGREEAAWKKFKLEWLASLDSTRAGHDLGPGKQKYFDVLSRTLSKEDVKEITQRPPKTFVYVFGILGWEDDAGTRTTEICSFFLSGAIGAYVGARPAGRADWHDCLSGHNVIATVARSQ